MKLLLDQNIPRKILPNISGLFPNSAHVYLLGLHEADDMAIWEYAKQNGYIIVTKDSDFHEIGLLNGIPPKVIWLRCGNGTSEFVSKLLCNKLPEIKEFFEDSTTFCLEIF